MGVEIDSIVTRTIDVDYILLDLIFLTFWIGFLIRQRYWVPILFGLMGWIIYLGVDYYLWYIVMETRTYEGPLPSGVFFAWFCLSPGFVQFSYCFVMLEKRNLKAILGWTGFYYFGWLAIGIFSKLISFNDTIIRVSRDMNDGNQRLIFLLLTVGNLVLALILKWKKYIRWEDLIYIYIVGTLVEMCLELTLSVSGIRLEQGTWSFQLFLVNTLIEFNMGITLIYLLWQRMYQAKYHRYPKNLSFNEFKTFKTNFSDIHYICTHAEEAKDIREKLEKIYSVDDILSDLDYYTRKYQPKLNILISNI